MSDVAPPPPLMISSTEPPEIRALGRSTTTPERYGVDVLWLTNAGLCGIQRKQFPNDFLASVSDDRLSRELGQAQTLDVKLLILEGRATFTIDGTLLGDDWNRSWTRDQLRACLWTVAAQGFWIEWTDGIGKESGANNTIHVIQHFVDWTRKGKHLTHRKRSAPRPVWGTPSSREYQIHMLQGLPDVGPELAERILDHFGHMPWRWIDGARDELLDVHGIGKKTADKILAALAIDNDAEVS